MWFEVLESTYQTWLSDTPPIIEFAMFRPLEKLIIKKIHTYLNYNSNEKTEVRIMKKIRMKIGGPILATIKCQAISYLMIFLMFQNCNIQN
jgi:hypothetical protein